MKIFDGLGNEIERAEPSTDIALIKAEKLQKADEIAREILEQSTLRHSALEKSTWTEKRRQAQKYRLTKRQSEVPALLAEATATVTFLTNGNATPEAITAALDELADSIEVQAQKIEELQAWVIGWRSAMGIAIGALETVEAVQAFVIDSPV